MMNFNEIYFTFSLTLFVVIICFNENIENYMESTKNVVTEIVESVLTYELSDEEEQHQGVSTWLDTIIP